MILRSILKKHLVKGKKGQLLIKLAGEDHLCKISIDDGNAIYISLGRKTADDALVCISNREIEGCNFIEDLPLTKRLEEPLNDKLFLLATINREPVESSVKVIKEVSPHRVEAAIDDFIEKVGPVGVVISESVLSKIMYEKGSPLNGEDYSFMLSSFLSEIPDGEKEGFKKSHLR